MQVSVPGSSLCCAPLPIFNGKDYNYWQKKMETFFISQGLWILVKNGKTLSASTAPRQIYEEEERRDAQALYYIQQAVTQTVFQKIFSESSAKTAWDILVAEYDHPNSFLGDIDFEAVNFPQVPEPSWRLSLTLNDQVPHSLRIENLQVYTPESVSIGPNHHGRPELVKMEAYKLFYAMFFLQRIQKEKELFVCYIKQGENRIRCWYPKPSELDSKKYVEMILVDSFFIFEFFSRYYAKHKCLVQYDPLFDDMSLRNTIWVDLLLIENQLPYSFLAELYHIATYDSGRNHRSFACISTMHLDLRDHNYIESIEKGIKNPIHFNALVWGYHCRSILNSVRRVDILSSFKCTAMKLSASKVKFEAVLDHGLMGGSEVSFNKMVLKLPRFEVDSTTEKIYCNMMSLELSNTFIWKICICSYILLLHSLMQTSDDVAVLVEAGVILNRLDSNQAVVDMFNKICNSMKIKYPCETFYYDTCKELDAYCSSCCGWWNYWTRYLKDVYFTNIWKGTGTIAATILLLLTLTQTITSILQVI